MSGGVYSVLLFGESRDIKSGEMAGNFYIRKAIVTEESMCGRGVK